MSNKHVALLVGALLSALPAAAQEAAARPGGGMFELLIMPVGLIAIFYFLLIRPQQQRAKKHSTMLAGLKRGDTVVTSGGLVGKVNKVLDDEVALDLSETVRVRVIKSMIIEVRGKAEPVAAND
ncbi:MAG TPA: preprotein translocase subunit YajC [Hyphomonas sp.]|nr:preprotein translocase subunit YajC [Hyphomonas sp.]